MVTKKRARETYETKYLEYLSKSLLLTLFSSDIPHLIFVQIGRFSIVTVMHSEILEKCFIIIVFF